MTFQTNFLEVKRLENAGRKGAISRLQLFEVTAQRIYKCSCYDYIVGVTMKSNSSAVVERW